MWPFLEIAGIFVPTYNLALAAGVLLGAVVIFFSARRKRVILRFFADNFLWFLLAIFCSARLVEIILHNYSLLDFPFFWAENGGFDFFGGVIGFLILLAVLARKYNENFFVWLDLVALASAPVLILHHLGTFLAGSNYGSPTNLPWGVIFTNPDSAVITTLPIHPVQIYSAILVLALFLTACAIFKKSNQPGKTGGFLLLTFSLGYFCLDFLRGDSAVAFGGLRASQYFALGLAFVAAILVFKMKFSAREARVGEIHIHPHPND